MNLTVCPKCGAVNWDTGGQTCRSCGYVRKIEYRAKKAPYQKKENKTG